VGRVEDGTDRLPDQPAGALAVLRDDELHDVAIGAVDREAPAQQHAGLLTAHCHRRELAGSKVGPEAGFGQREQVVRADALDPRDGRRHLPRRHPRPSAGALPG
jgi:hypothetical protein